MKNWIFLFIILLSFQIIGNAASSERGIQRTQELNEARTALVIGNSDYKISPLKNPKNDARDMAKVLQENGFAVTLVVNASQKEMEIAIRSFGKQLRHGGTGLFYYAGHGIQINGRNYLIPLKATIESETDVKYEAVDAGLVLGKMEDAGNNFNIVILDACRNNPFTRSFRSAKQGLARMDAPQGSIIAYATGPGAVAADGEDGNGIYTKHLIQKIKKPGLTIEQVLKQVRVAVANETANKQIPWEYSSLMGVFYFSQKSEINNGSNPLSAAIYKIDDEEEMWLMVKETSDVKDIEEFLLSYPNGRFKNHAKLKQSQLNRKHNASSLQLSQKANKSKKIYQLYKVGHLDIQKILNESGRGKQAKKILDAKANELNAKFKRKSKSLVALKKEIEKKSPIWSNEKKDQKIRIFRKQRQELEVMGNDFKLDLQQMQKTLLAPILRDLQSLISNFSEENNYDFIFEQPNNVEKQKISEIGILYHNHRMGTESDILALLNKSDITFSELTSSTKNITDSVLKKFNNLKN